MKIPKDTREYLITKIRTIDSRLKTLNKKRSTDFQNREAYEKWHKKQLRTIDSMKQVLDNMFRSLAVT